MASAGAAMTFRVLGWQAVAKALSDLPKQAQSNIVRSEIIASAERIKNELLLNLSGRRARENTGNLLRAFEAQPVKADRVPASQGLIRYGLAWPDRASLGIPSTAKGYYPTALEYGTKERYQREVQGTKLDPFRKLGSIVARRFVRDAIDDNRKRELRLIITGIKKKVERWWDRQARGQARGLQL